MIAYITGASSGLGAYTAQALVDAGWTVVAGARSFTGETDGRMTRLPLDVTRDDSVRDFVERAKQIGAPDAVIHCAAVLCFGSCEETALADYARVMETNFLGMVRVNQQVLPLMREKGGGKVVLFSSINGLMGLPFQSAYTASKHAIEGYAECLAQEVDPFGIQVMLIEPGDHRGGSSRCRLTSAAMTDASPYWADFRKGTEAIRRDEENGSDPAKLGRCVAELLAREKLPFRKKIGSPAQMLAPALHKVLPGRAMNRILRQYTLGGK